MNKMDETIYSKCMKLAANANTSQMGKRVFNRDQLEFCFGAALWSQAWEDYDKKRITEEEIKYYFHLGFVPEYSKTYENIESKVRQNKRSMYS